MSEHERARAASTREESLHRDEQNDSALIQSVSNGGALVRIFNDYRSTRRSIVAEFDGEVGWTQKDLRRFLRSDVSRRLRPKLREMAFKTGRLILLICGCGGLLVVIQLFRMQQATLSSGASPQPSAQPAPFDPFANP